MFYLASDANGVIVPSELDAVAKWSVYRFFQILNERLKRVESLEQ